MGPGLDDLTVSLIVDALVAWDILEDQRLLRGLVVGPGFGPSRKKESVGIAILR